jgi:hypothetical protein
MKKHLASNRPLRPLSSEAGFSLLELLIASLVSVLVVGGVLTMLVGLEEVHRDTQELIDAQQMARLSLDQMTRDLQLSGVGLAWLLPPFPLVVPRADGGVDIRHNQGNITGMLVADMGGPGDALIVDSAVGFEAGQTIGVYDAMGSIDLVDVISVDLGANRIVHSGASKAYLVADGTAVARIETISYMIQNVGGVPTLVRQVDNQAAQPIASQIQTLNIVYWDDSNPAVAFNPVALVDQLRIRTVELTLTIQTENVRLNTVQRRTASLTTRVTPRAIALS